MPLRTTQRKASRITSSSAGVHVMKRMPVVMKLSGVFGIAALTSRVRSHGSSWWKRTATPMCVLDVKSAAWKPNAVERRRDRRMSAVLRPVALQRLWFPSRVVVSTMLDRAASCVVAPRRGRVAQPYSTSSAFSAQISAIVPADAGGDRVHHLHHLDQADDRVASTREPTSTNGAAPGAGAR